MKRIACIGWGSLLWKTGPLPLASSWRHDGPPLPLEFARVSDGGELAIVLCEQAPAAPTFWALLDVADLDQARERLRQREKIDPAHPEWVGSHAPLMGGGPAVIAEWAQRHALDAVVWTALPPRLSGEEGRLPSLAEAVAYLDGLRGTTREHAEHYIRHVPPIIRTPYRAHIEHELGWTPAQME